MFRRADRRCPVFAPALPRCVVLLFCVVWPFCVTLLQTSDVEAAHGHGHGHTPLIIGVAPDEGGFLARVVLDPEALPLAGRKLLRGPPSDPEDRSQRGARRGQPIALGPAALMRYADAVARAVPVRGCQWAVDDRPGASSIRGRLAGLTLRLRCREVPDTLVFEPSAQIEAPVHVELIRPGEDAVRRRATAGGKPLELPVRGSALANAATATTAPPPHDDEHGHGHGNGNGHGHGHGDTTETGKHLHPPGAHQHNHGIDNARSGLDTAKPDAFPPLRSGPSAAPVATPAWLTSRWRQAGLVRAVDRAAFFVLAMALVTTAPGVVPLAVATLLGLLAIFGGATLVLDAALWASLGLGSARGLQEPLLGAVAIGVAGVLAFSTALKPNHRAPVLGAGALVVGALVGLDLGAVSRRLALGALHSDQPLLHVGLAAVAPGLAVVLVGGVAAARGRRQSGRSVGLVVATALAALVRVFVASA